jgi:anaerobic magnesium-protoporphyrin IX monomethyl ester cyclase
MRILMINVPHPAIGSRVPDEHLPPLGLLAIGGPLLDDGHEVSLLDAEFGPMSIQEIQQEASRRAPDAVLFGHSGSSSADPIVAEVSQAVRERLPTAHIIYGGVYPTYHWREVLTAQPQIDVVVRGEGEETIRRLIRALEQKTALDAVEGIAYREDGVVVSTRIPEVISNLDAYRIGWELIDFRRYSYWDKRRAVVVQFSRGCHHQCSYCGQRGFWRRWRHRDPKAFAKELARLHREQGVEVINFADENPAASKRVWRTFLEALIEEKVPLILVGSIRADDIVRDADILHLYKRAGFERFLLGIESYDADALIKVRKGGSVSKDRQAIQLLRREGILSMATMVVGFAERSDKDFYNNFRHLLSYDPDQIQIIYATPHQWTDFYEENKSRKVILPDQRKWDYKHQVLALEKVPAWRVFVWVKLMEAGMQLRPKAVGRLLLHPDRSIRRAMRWYYKIGIKVWFHQVGSWRWDQMAKTAESLAVFWDKNQQSRMDGSRPHKKRPSVTEHQFRFVRRFRSLMLKRG